MVLLAELVFKEFCRRLCTLIFFYSYLEIIYTLNFALGSKSSLDQTREFDTAQDKVGTQEYRQPPQSYRRQGGIAAFRQKAMARPDTL